MDTVLIDLNSENVEGVFLRCLTGPTSKQEDAVPIQLMLTHNGFEKGDNPIFFDMKKVNECKELIDYLFGQLDVIHHSKFRVVDVDTLNKKYDGTIWASHPKYVLQLCYLGVASQNSKKWIKNASTNKIMVALNSNIIPIPYAC